MVNTLPRTLFDTLMTTKFQLQNYTKLSSFHCITYCRTSSYLYSIPKVLTYRIQRGLYCHVQQLYIRNNYQTTRNVTEPMLKTTYHSYLTPDPPFIPQNPSLKRDLIREPPTPITTTNTHNLDPAPKEKQQHINQTRPEIPNAPLKPAISPKPSSPGSPNLEICCTSASRQELSSDECAAFAGSWGVSNWFFFSRFTVRRGGFGPSVYGGVVRGLRSQLGRLELVQRLWKVFCWEWEGQVREWEWEWCIASWGWAPDVNSNPMASVGGRGEFFSFLGTTSQFFSALEGWRVWLDSNTLEN